ncbi:TonB-dependent receptor [Pandoraea apista]|uniref:TonB-dependent receptor n=1 Tax=Pandoraea apista TaxID=93218 RepID=UPI0005A7BAAB|nr:TonB-dependent receptor [Pandoraea apista]AJZ74883.1 TonB-dependent receptor [Pandoraea apista]AKH74111.1 TonB-dependent receptor [Pandoraea apista]AKI62659.1 TonB-dependent receptor [Pandoraea apista]
MVARSNLSRFGALGRHALAAAAASAVAVNVYAQTAAPPGGSAAAATPDDANVSLSGTTVSAKRLDAARNALSPDTGSSVYNFDQSDIQTLPLGANTPLNQVLLQAPGVVQDSYGQLHVRGDHANLQYRIDGVIIPEAISGFGQAIDARIASQINLITGALPAQFGYRTAGIVDIHTKGSPGLADDTGEPPKAFGGEVGVVFGSHADREVNTQLYGTKGALSYYFSARVSANDLGIENPTGDRNAIHDHTNQTNAFGMMSYLLNADNRVSFMFGTANNRFQIPNLPGVAPAFSLDNGSIPDSSSLNANQQERTEFQVLSWQSHLSPKLDTQLSLFHRTSRVDYTPDPIGDLVYNGVAANITRRNEAYGVQSDSSYKLTDRHTLRFGLFVQQEHFSVDNTSSVFPAVDGQQTSGTPISIVDNASDRGTTYGLYLQDEWKATERLTINYGARYDHVNTVTDEGQLSPRLGLTYDLTSRTRVHAGYARYFTPPATEKIDTTSVAKFLNTTNALPSDANTAVRAERSDYFDLGVSHQLTSSITVGLDAYYRNVRHLQDEGQFGNALIYSTFNYDKGRIYGVEGTVNYRQGNVGAYLNVAVSRAMGQGIETGQFNFDADELAYINNHWVHLDHDQQVTASAGVSYQWGQTLLSADALFGSGLRSGFANSEHLPAYYQVNLGVGQKISVPGLGRFDAKFSIINLFDRVYELRDGTGIGVGAPQFGPRRTFYLAMSKPF